MRGIAQCRWSSQHIFRHGVDGAAKHALRAIGAGADLVALAVGFRATPEDSDQCIETEAEPIALANLSGVDS